MTIVVNLLMSEDLVFDREVRHSWDDSARGPDPVYHGPLPVLTDEASLRLRLAWEIDMGEGTVDDIGAPRVGTPSTEPYIPGISRIGPPLVLPSAPHSPDLLRNDVPSL